MSETLGKRIAQLRHKRGLKQDDVAQRLNLSAQAVSKWENDVTSPDIGLLPELSRLLGVTIDELLMGEAAREVRMVKEGQKAFEDMILHITISNPEGEKTEVKLPMPIVAGALSEGEKQGKDGEHSFKLERPDGKGDQTIDLAFVIDFARKGVIGNMVEVMGDDGTVVSICVE